MSTLLAIAATIAITATMRTLLKDEPAHDMGITLKAELINFQELF